MKRVGAGPGWGGLVPRAVNHLVELQYGAYAGHSGNGGAGLARWAR